MPDQEGSRREEITLLAVDPKTGERSCRVQISFTRMQTVGRRSVGHAKECGNIVPMILKNPTAIFEGLRRDEDEDRWGYGWRCYCGVPTCSYRADGTEGDAYPGQIYLVFLNDQKVAYNWRWEKCDPNDTRLPLNHESRFKKKLL